MTKKELLPRHFITIEGDSPSYLAFINRVSHLIEYNIITLNLEKYGKSIIPPKTVNYYEIQIAVESLYLKNPFKDLDESYVNKWEINDKVNAIQNIYYMCTSNSIMVDNVPVNEFLFDNSLLFEMMDGDYCYVKGFEIKKAKPNQKYNATQLSLTLYDLEKLKIVYKTLIDPKIMMEQLNKTIKVSIDNAIKDLQTIEINKSENTISEEKYNSLTKSTLPDIYEDSKIIEDIRINDETLICIGGFLKKYDIFLFTKTVESGTSKRSKLINMITHNNNTSLKSRLELIIKDLEVLKNKEIKYKVETIKPKVNYSMSLDEFK